MDPRLAFLKTTREGLPLPVVFDSYYDAAAPYKVAMNYWPAKIGVAGPPEQLNMLILGNPGLLAYYDEFIEYLRGLLPDSHAFMVVSHVGHDPTVPEWPDEPLSLAQQLEVKVELTRAVLRSLAAWHREVAGKSVSEDGISESASASESGSDATRTGSRASADDAPEGPRLVLLGHSVGAWLGNEVVRRVRGVYAMYMLFPTLGWIAQTSRGWAHWPMFKRPLVTVLPSLAGLVSRLLPLTAYNAPETMTLLGSPQTLRHVLGLARSEMETIKAPNMAWFRAQQAAPPGRGLYSIWSGGRQDGWVGREGPMIQDALGAERVVVLDGVRHAFCLDEKFWQPVGDNIAAWILGNTPRRVSLAPSATDAAVVEVGVGPGAAATGAELRRSPRSPLAALDVPGAIAS